MDKLAQLQGLVKALEAGGYNAAPGTLVQGSALQVEDLSPVMQRHFRRRAPQAHQASEG